MSNKLNDIGRLKASLEDSREKLLDLTSRNPLLSTKLAYRSNSYIRVIDEQPEQVLGHIYDDEKKMEFTPLPSNRQDPKDEENEEFQNDLAEAKQIDEEYLQGKMEIINERYSKSARDEEYKKLERKLKDKIREKRGMNPHLHDKSPKQFTYQEVCQHAKNNYIRSDYELPTAGVDSGDRRYSDNKIQTLFMPEVLEMRVRGVTGKSREWNQETGINVMHAAFGFVEWKDSDKGKEHYAPLLLLPITIEKKSGGVANTFQVSSSGDALEPNRVLELKLKNDFDMELPKFKEEYSLEDYFAKISAFFKKKDNFEVKRWIVFGVFPSQRMAMYRDLNPSEKLLLESEMLMSILATGESLDNGLPSLDEELEQPDYHNKKSHYPVCEIDPSQFGVLRLAMQGRNLAVEGPPGTGKSQTIVNIIAAALGEGKSVLFVAEKMAALEVVKARLDAVELGQFALPLQATRANAKDVIESIKDRVFMRGKRNPHEYEEKIEEYEKIRNKLNLYCETLDKEYKNTDLKIHKIIGKCILEADFIKEHADIFNDEGINQVRPFNKKEIEELKEQSMKLNEAWSEKQQHLPYWENQKASRRDAFSVREICDLVKKMAECYRELSEVHEKIFSFGFSEITDAEELSIIAQILKSLSEEQTDLDFTSLRELAERDKLQKLQIFIGDCKKMEEMQNCLSYAETAREFLDIIEEGKDFPIDSLKPARDLVLSIPDEILHLRPSESRDTDIEKQVTKLVNRMDKLQENGRLEAMPKHSEIEHCYNELSNSGLLSFIFPRHREVRKEYMSFSLHKSFNKNKAVAELENLKEQRKLYDDCGEQLQELFDGDIALSNDGLKKLQDLKGYYKSIQSKLPSSRCKAFRDFLKFSEMSSLLIIPEIEVIRDALSADRNCNLGQLTQDFFELYEKLENKITNDEEMKALLADNFSGVETDVSVFADEIRIANLLHDWQNKHFEEKSIIAPLIGVFENNKIDGVCHLIDKIHAKREEINEKVASLDERAIVSDHLIRGSTYSEISDNLIEASNDKVGLQAHSRYEEIREQFTDKGFDWLLPKLLKGNQSLDNVDKFAEVSAYYSYLRQIYADFEIGKSLSKYDGYKLTDLQKKLAKIDKQIIKMHRRHLQNKLLKNDGYLPKGDRRGKRADWTEMQLLYNEMEKITRFAPMRRLTNNAGKSLIMLKPCWMMSPLAVAKYLPHGTVRFDLCIIDEASQMPPEEALGALARCGQAIIVGDTNQLPPTPFFKRHSSSEDDEEESDAPLEESVLNLANNIFQPRKRLNWHYRSNHHSLIAFSNHKMYNNELNVIPSPQDETHNKGVFLKEVGGTYITGTNQFEAEAVVAEVLNFMCTRPNESLGVVTMNMKQKELLNEMFDDVFYNERNIDARVKKYRNTWEEKNEGLEAFFVKNLENVQGDERDVIFISTLYGPEIIGGKVAQRFGPISGSAGKRRLNVLFSRAKNQVVTFTSMKPSDISAIEEKNPGAYMLKEWLNYSKTGKLPIQAKKTERPPDSEFEIAVADTIKNFGYGAEPQIGSSGFFIDIGVHQPELGYIMGVECDGASYHSNKDARVRDYLRQEILESNGWHIYRVWSTDWFNNRDEEIKKLKQAIEKRLDDLKNGLDERNAQTKTGTAPLEQDGNSDFELKSEETGFTFSSREE